MDTETELFEHCCGGSRGMLSWVQRWYGVGCDRVDVGEDFGFFDAFKTSSPGPGHERMCRSGEYYTHSLNIVEHRDLINSGFG